MARKARADVLALLSEDDKRLALLNEEFDPISGKGSVPCRRRLFSIDEVSWWLPEEMWQKAVVRELRFFGGICRWCRGHGLVGMEGEVKRQLMLLRCRCDFPFWAAMFVKIKDKNGSSIPFVLNRPQRKTLGELEGMRLRGEPIRMIILKARQWGGSTLVQMYMAWIQLLHKQGWNSVIVAHQSSSAMNIRNMYRRMVSNYPPSMLGLDDGVPLTLTPLGGSRNDVTISQGRKQVRDMAICVGSMQSPDSVRGQDIAMAHFSEVGLMYKTDNRTPEDLIQAVSSAIKRAPLTVDVLESTAKGEGNLFHNEWLAAKDGVSARCPVFVAWYEIEMYRESFRGARERREFAQRLIDNKEGESVKSEREEPGKYLWWLWQKGATLEAIKWYVDKRRDYRSHDQMASEFPSDDIEAFAHSGQPIFDAYKVDELREGCRVPTWRGDLRGADETGAGALRDLEFINDGVGDLRVWEKPDKEYKRMRDRYVVSVDVGGKGEKSDWSVIVVIDRWWRTQGDGDVIVAEWRGHIRHDLLAWKMAQIAEWYNTALLVVESNTYEADYSKSEGDHSMYILDQIGREYRNLYARQASADSVRRLGKARRWGFQTNGKTKEEVIANLRVLIDTGGYVEREAGACDEYSTYQRDERGKPNAVEGAHDDRVMARAIGLWVSGQLPVPKMPGSEAKIGRVRLRRGGMSRF